MVKKEALHIQEIAKGNMLDCIGILERQMNVLQSRAQVLISIASIVLTITGFSGHRIAQTNRFAQVCVVVGLAITLLSALWVWRKVMAIRWVTGIIDDDLQAGLEKVIEMREKKTKAYSVGGILLFIGLAVYCLAFSIMLFKY